MPLQYGNFGVTSFGTLKSVEPARPNIQLAGAGGTLIGFTAACAVLGLLVGWALGSSGIGLLIGLVVGIPVGIVAVYRRYRGAF
jgi:hypothetical protein